MFPEFPDPALILKLPVAPRVLKTARVPSVMRAQIFFLMVSEQVNLIHERRPYGKIEKKY